MYSISDIRLPAAWLGAAVLLCGTPVLAQEEAPSDDVGVEVEEAGLTPAESYDTEGAPFRRVTDEEETIYSVQQKAYLIEGKLEASLMFSALFNDRFIQSYAPVGSLTYHLGENFGVEVFGGYLFPNESDATTELRVGPEVLPEYASLTQLLWAAGVGAQWSPIYGKVRIAGNELGNFSFYLTGGLAFGQTRVQCLASTTAIDPGFDQAECDPGIGNQEIGPDDTFYEPATFRPMGVIGGGLRFYFSERLGAKVEVRDYIFASRVFRPEESDPNTTTTNTGAAANQLRYSDTIRNNLYLNLGISFLF